MKKILLLTAILVVAFTVNAFAAHTSSPPAGTVSVSIPDIFHLTVSAGNMSQSFSVSESDVLNQVDQTISNAFTLLAQSNVNSTTVSAKRTAFQPVFPTPGTADGDFSLSTNNWDSGTLSVPIPDDGSSTADLTGGAWTQGVNDTSVFGYKLGSISVADDSGDYSTTVTFTMASNN